LTNGSQGTVRKVSWSRLREAYGWGSAGWACVLLLTALGALSIGLGLEMRRAHDPLGGRFFPVVIPTLLAIAAVAILVGPVVRAVVGLSPTVGVPAGAAGDVVAGEAGLLAKPGFRVLAMVVVCVGYVMLLRLAGYIPASILALAACMYLLGTRGLRGLVIMPVVTTALLYAVFTYALFVRLP
jgi:hypothetical protein